MPPKPDSTARYVGVATIPLTTAGAAYVGWQLCPPLAPPPSSIIDLGGLSNFARSLPLRHVGTVGAMSAVGAATVCRVVQHRNGA